MSKCFPSMLEVVKMTRYLTGVLFFLAICHVNVQPVRAEPPLATLITPSLIESVRGWSSVPVVRLTLAELNRRQADLDQAGIDALDRQWRDERGTGDQPLITAVMSSPLSGYLLRIQAASAGLYTRSEEHTSELQSLLRISYAVFCL